MSDENCEKCHDTGVIFEQIDDGRAGSLTFISRHCDCPAFKDYLNRVLNTTLEAFFAGKTIILEGFEDCLEQKPKR